MLLVNYQTLGVWLPKPCHPSASLSLTIDLDSRSLVILSVVEEDKERKGVKVEAARTLALSLTNFLAALKFTQSMFLTEVCLQKFAS